MGACAVHLAWTDEATTGIHNIEMRPSISGGYVWIVIFWEICLRFCWFLLLLFDRAAVRFWSVSKYRYSCLSCVETGISTRRTTIQWLFLNCFTFCRFSSRVSIIHSQNRNMGNWLTRILVQFYKLELLGYIMISIVEPTALVGCQSVSDVFGSLIQSMPVRMAIHSHSRFCMSPIVSLSHTYTTALISFSYTYTRLCNRCLFPIGAWLNSSLTRLMLTHTHAYHIHAAWSMGSCLSNQLNASST